MNKNMGKKQQQRGHKRKNKVFKKIIKNQKISDTDREILENIGREYL